jgi:alginate O-acetyltransferase complex protein AlgJ
MSVPGDWRVRIEEILGAIEKIDTSTRGMTLGVFVGNTRAIGAVVRQLKVIGEASKHLDQTTMDAAPEVPWKNLKNIPTQIDSSVDVGTIWRTLDYDLPPLVAPLGRLLAKQTVPARRRIAAMPNGLLVAGFLVLIFAPLFGYATGCESGAVAGENRFLAKAPAFAWSGLTGMPAQFEAHYRDYFGFRGRLIHLDNILRRKWLRVSNDDVVFGREGWLFYAREDLIADYLGRVPLSSADLKRWTTFFEDRADLLDRLGVRYLLVIAPDKASIYPEMLPKSIAGRAGVTRQDQFLAHLRETHSALNVLDLRQPLRDAKERGLVYFPQDTHWNGRGFFVAYQEICRSLRKWYPDIRPQEFGVDYDLRQIAWSGGEWSMFGLASENLSYPSLFLNPLGTQRSRKTHVDWPAALPTIKDPASAVSAFERHGTGRNLLLLRDSFMRSYCLDREHQPLAEHFGRTVHVNALPNLAQLATLVDAYDPDVVVEERAERFFRVLPGADAWKIGVPRQLSPASANKEFHPPVPESMSRSTGANTEQIYTVTLSDGDGSRDIAWAEVVFHNVVRTDHACFVRYDARTNELGLADDASLHFVASAPPGTTSRAENSQCVLDIAGASVVKSGTTVTLKMPLTFKRAFKGTKECFVLAGDSHQVQSGWWSLGLVRVR